MDNDNQGNNRDYGNEIDSLKEGLSEIKNMLGQMFRRDNDGNVHVHADNGEPHTDPRHPEEDGDDHTETWADYGRKMGEYGREIGRRATEYGREASRRAAEMGAKFSKIPRPSKPPKPPKPPKVGLFYGTGLDKIGETVRQSLSRGFKEMEESLRDLNLNLDMVDISFKPQIDSINAKLAEDGVHGIVTYVGGFKPYDGETVTWSVKERTFEHILSSLHSSDVEKVLSAIGSRQKLDILLSLLHAPMTVNEIVAYLNLNTTGQAYHHLNNLIAAKLVDEVPGAKGVYTINPNRVQGLIMILVGVRDLLNAPNGGDADWNNGQEEDRSN